MIESLYSKYFQKSKSFLYPALGITKKNKISPIGTYISIKGKIGPEEMRLICVFKTSDDEEYKDFESQMLLSNPLFEKHIETKGYKIYIFNMEMYKHDWFSFLLGKYSQLSSVLKKAIRHYYGEKSSEYKYIDTYLYPEKYFELYSKLLAVDIKILKSTGELCSACDLEKETLEIPKEDLDLL